MANTHGGHILSASLTMTSCCFSVSIWLTGQPLITIILRTQCVAGQCLLSVTDKQEK